MNFYVVIVQRSAKDEPVVLGSRLYDNRRAAHTVVENVKLQGRFHSVSFRDATSLEVETFKFATPWEPIL